MESTPLIGQPANVLGPRSLGRHSNQAAPGNHSHETVQASNGNETMTNNTTLTDSAYLSLPVGVLETWVGYCWLYLDATSALMDIKLDFNRSSGSGHGYFVVLGPATSVAASPFAIEGQTPQSMDQGTPQSIGVLLGGSTAVIYWSYVGGTIAGDITLQWAQNTADAGTLYIIAKSYMVGWKTS